MLFTGLLLFLTTITQAQVKINFSFQLKTAATTSAGVFSKNGTLIRSLWSRIPYKAGSYTQSWDGMDDEGQLLTGTGYQVRVLSNNINYQWEGIIGNTSAASSGPTVHHAFETWYTITEKCDWANFNEMKNLFNSVDAMSNDLYVFTIKGNHYRLIARVIFRVRTVYIKFIGTHKEYDKVVLDNL